MKITISADGTVSPPGNADYVTDSVQPDGSKTRHYVCRSCLEVFDAPDAVETVHECVEGPGSAAGAAGS